MFTTRFFVPILFVSVAGCSIHPLPENVTRKTTYDIVKKLRCEAREGVLREKLPPKALANIVIGFDFSFDITETNKAENGALEFIHPYLGGGSFALDINGKAEKSRNNVRFFRIIDTFQGLKDYKFCNEEVESANPAYPISGTVGIDEVVNTFIKLERLSKLTITAKSGDNIFSETLKYTTDLTAGVNPTLMLRTAAGSLKLKEASVDASVQRKDIHQVTIAIAPLDKDTHVSDLIGERRFSRGAAVSARNPAAPVILELERLRNRDEDTRLFEQLRLLQ
jgi:hypothetical protein